MGRGQRAGTRERQFKAVDAYVEQAGSIGADPLRDRSAKVVAMDRAGFVHFETDEAKVRHFNRIWRGDDTRAYICESYAMANPDDACPLSFIARNLREHVEQRDSRWGAPDRSASLAALSQMTKIYVPSQTARVATLSLSARVDRPSEFDGEPAMAARAILPAGQKIAKPVPPPGDEDEEGDGDEQA